MSLFQMKLHITEHKIGKVNLLLLLQKAPSPSCQLVLTMHANSSTDL